MSLRNNFPKLINNSSSLNNLNHKCDDVCISDINLTCDHTLPPLYLGAVKEGMIHLLVGSYVKKPDSGVFADWSRNNAYETLCSYWLTYFNLISGQKVETEARF